MSFTKVAPAGIGTEPGTSILIGDSLLHSTGIDIGSNTGIGVTIRKHGDATFTGIITASAFFGDGSGLEGVSSSGIGTPLSDDDTSDLNKVYYVNQELSIGSTVTVNHPSSAVASYTHYQDLVVTDDADFIVSDGDTFIPDVLGIRTSTSTASAATGGRIRAGTITNAGANGAPNFPNGLTGTAGTFTGNLNVAGVLTYEDVTNVDSVGVITARAGVNLVGNDLNVGSNIKIGNASGIVTATSFSGDGSSLTGVGASFGNSSVNSTGIGTFSALVSNTAFSHRNVVINGGMQIYQRGDVTGATSHTYGGPDRFRVARSGAGTFSQKSVGVTGAFGIQRALQIDCTTQSGSLAAGALQIIQHKIEGYNAQRFEKGYPTAKQFALSFYAYSEKGGTYTVALEDTNNSRYVSASYTVTANTWEKHEVIFPADTTGKLDNDNGESLNIEWWLSAGSNYSSGTFTTSWASAVSANKVHPSQVNMGESTNNNFYLANVQLEVGSVCTPFEYKSFTEDLTACQRYYRRWQATSGSFNGNGTPGLARMTTSAYYDTSNLANGTVLDGDDAYVMRPLSPSMRRKPTVSVNNLYLGSGLSTYNNVHTLQVNNSWNDMLALHIDNEGGMTAGQCVHLVLVDDSSYLIADAEI